jgi:hypothetical protein
MEAPDAWDRRRVRTGVEVDREAEAQAPALVLGPHVQRDSPDESVLDRSVLIGQARVPCRLLA